jgi:hypothetical protein
MFDDFGIDGVDLKRVRLGARALIRHFLDSGGRS